jgi:hypothetical protein
MINQLAMRSLTTSIADPEVGTDRHTTRRDPHLPHTGHNAINNFVSNYLGSISESQAVH